MRVLTVNAGSTSLKIERYDIAAALPAIADPPVPAYALSVAPGPDAGEAIAAAAREADVVAHRFVRLPDPALAVVPIGGDFAAAVAAVGPDAPLHDAAALRAVDAVARAVPAIPQLAVADGAFHRTLSAPARTYALPREITRRGLRRLGFHGLSHEYAAHRACAMAGIDVMHADVVTAHLGGGSSLCAIHDGASIDTTMGYTPLDGLPMATRSGSVDPGILVHLLREGTSVDDLDAMLQRRSGLLGISGRSGDLHELLQAGDADARLAIDVLCWRLRAGIGAMIGVLGAVDAIVFTGGIGEHAASVRDAGARGAQALGARIDAARNALVTADGCISAGDSAVGLYVVCAREGWQLARAAYAYRSPAVDSIPADTVESAFATSSSSWDMRALG